MVPRAKNDLDSPWYLPVSEQTIFIILLCLPGRLASGFPLEPTPYFIGGGNNDEGRGCWHWWFLSGKPSPRAREEGFFIA